MILKKLFRPKVHPIHIDDSNFQELVLESELPFILDIWGSTCPACKRLEEVMVSIATDFDGKIVVGEMGTHFAPRAATQLQISKVPTVIYFDKGKELERMLGFRGSLFHRESIEELFGVTK